MNRTQFLIVLGLTAGTVFGVALLLATILVPYVRSRQRPPADLAPAVPAALIDPGVRQGAGLLSKSVWLAVPEVGEVTDIRQGEFEPGHGREFGVAGTLGAVFVDEAGSVRSTIRFASLCSHVDLIDVEEDGACEFLDRGGRGWQDAHLLDHAGAEAWKYGGGVNDMAAGDLDGDGTLAFVVGFNGSSGVHLLDRAGRRLTEQSDGNVMHVETVDTDADGKLEIVHSNAAGELTVRDARGRRIRSVKTPAPFSRFVLCRWPGVNEPLPTFAAGGHLLAISYDGTERFRLDAPDAADVASIAAARVKLRESEPEHLAVVLAFENWNRSILYVYDSVGRLIYREVLEELCLAIARRPPRTGRAESILLGGSAHVWELQIPSHQESQSK
jgi:hypothetical protein